MSEQLKFENLDDVSDQMNFGPNVGERDHRTKGWRRLSPGLLHAKVAREPQPTPAAEKNAPVDSPVVPEVVSVLPRVISTPDDLLDMLRRRRNELGITLETIDSLTGWAERLAGKLLSPEPTKQLGEQSLGLVLQALAMGIVHVTFVEDPELAARMRHRWTKRRRPHLRTRRTRSQLSGALLDHDGEQSVACTTEEHANGKDVP